ncbi:MAG: hypothetical protein J4473_00335 [Candidatus Aenigmarchaeota archaeon]|nr:hypothetical protein [Candidatus Aenigmarchaeota archaeon]
MDDSEAKLWQIIDIGGYAVAVTVLRENLKYIRQKISREHLDENFREAVTQFDNVYELLGKRIGLIDLEQLDERFPIPVLLELKTEYPQIGDE